MELDSNVIHLLAIAEIGPASYFELDGKIVTRVNDGNISVFHRKGNGKFGPRADFPAGANPLSIVSGDFNADGRLDVAVALVNACRTANLSVSDNGGGSPQQVSLS